MSLRPLQSRILVRPDTTPEQNGLIVIPDNARKPPPMSGEVIAVGQGPASAKQVRLETIAECIALVEETTMAAATRNGLLDALAAKQMQATESELHVGDFVVFAYTAGTTVTYDGETFILLMEDEVLGVCEEKVNAA